MQTHGKLYLRLVYAETEEIEEEIVSIYTSNLMNVLKRDFQQKLGKRRKLWTLKDSKFCGYRETLRKYHPKWRQIQLKAKIEGA